MFSELMLRFWPYLAHVLVLVLVCWLQSFGLPGFFLLDDIPNLSGLGRVDAQGAMSYVLNGVASSLGRPLSLLTFWAQAESWPLDPAAFKRVNVLIHLFNGLLLFCILRSLARAVYGKPAESWVLALVFLWLVLPIHVSTVHYVVQRMTLLAATFSLLSILLYVNCRLQVSRFSVLAFVGLSGAVVIGYLGILAKETAILTGWMLLFIELVLLSKVRPLSGALWSVWKVVALWLPPLLVFAVVLSTHNVFGDLTKRDWNWSQRLLTQPVVLWDYVGRILLPMPSSINFFNDHIAPKRHVDMQVFVSVALWLCALTMVCVRNPRYAPVRTLGLASVWFLLTHALESSIIPLELVFEHRNYLPSLALAGVFVAFFQTCQLVRSALFSKALTLIFLLYIAYVTVISIIEIKTWSTEEKFVTAAVMDRPNSVRANQQLAEYYAANEMYIEASMVIRKLVEAQPMRPGLMLQLIYLQCFDSRVLIPEEQYLDAALRHGRFDMATEIIGEIRELKELGGCQSLTWDDYRSYITRLYVNPRYKSFKKAFVKLRADAYLVEGDYSSAHQEMEKISAHRAGLPLMMQKVRYAAIAEQYERCLTLIEITKKKHQKLQGKKLLVFSELPDILAEIERKVLEKMRIKNAQKTSE